MPTKIREQSFQLSGTDVKSRGKALGIRERPDIFSFAEAGTSYYLFVEKIRTNLLFSKTQCKCSRLDSAVQLGYFVIGSGRLPTHLQKPCQPKLSTTAQNGSRNTTPRRNT